MSCSTQERSFRISKLMVAFRDAERVIEIVIANEDTHEPYRYLIRAKMARLVRQYVDFLGPQYLEEQLTDIHDQFAAAADLTDEAMFIRCVAQVVFFYAVYFERLIKLGAVPKGSTHNSVVRLVVDYANGRWNPSLPPRIPLKQPDPSTPSSSQSTPGSSITWSSFIGKAKIKGAS
jgi:hypothetical protein